MKVGDIYYKILPNLTWICQHLFCWSKSTPEYFVVCFRHGSNSFRFKSVGRK